MMRKIKNTTEPSGEARRSAAMYKDYHQALIGVGFDKSEALVILGYITQSAAAARAGAS